MAQITTHTLNALDGTHASNVEVKLSVHGTEIFSGTTDEGGRLKFCIDISIYESTDEFSLSFGIGKLWEYDGKSVGKTHDRGHACCSFHDRKQRHVDIEPKGSAVRSSAQLVTAVVNLK